MMCKECINFECCKSQNSEKISYYDGLSCMENKCHGFKNTLQYIKLPCKVGDTVYVDTRTLPKDIPPYLVNIKEENLPAYFVGKVVSFHITEKKKFVKIRIRNKNTKKWFDGCYSISFGKTVFLTREEAEKALGGIK